MTKHEEKTHHAPRQHKEQECQAQIEGTVTLKGITHPKDSENTKDVSKANGFMQKVIRSVLAYIHRMAIKESSAFWTMIFTGILAVTTVLLVIVTGKVDETTRMTQRAFVSLKTIQFLVPRIDATVDINKVASHEFMAVWENSGTTPTKKAISYAVYKATDGPLPADFTFPDNGDHSPAVIGARGTIYTGRLSIPIKDIQNKKHLYLWGSLVYYDIFDKTPMRLTEFCFEANFVGDTTTLDNANRSGAIGWFFTNCEKHNCYDENCPDYKEHRLE